VGKRDKYVGRLERVLFIKVILPPLDVYMIHLLSTSQPPLNLFNNTIPNRLGLKTGSQRETKVLQGQRRNPTTQNASKFVHIIHNTHRKQKPT